jgi:N,N'-diacetyllegionaminate synthase
MVLPHGLKKMYKTFIIAEVGPNHNGSLELAKRYVDSLCRIGVNAIKFQLSNPQRVYSKDSFKADYQIQDKRHNSPLEMSKSHQLSPAEHFELSKYCISNGVEYLCTAFDLESLKYLDDVIGIGRYKIASGEIFSLDILDYIRSKTKPIILSTGMATYDEITRTVEYLNEFRQKDITVLHCISSYPAMLSNVNMNVMSSIEERYHCPVGFSDHTLGNLSSIVAVSKGASVIEKHVTFDKKMPGPDHKASATIHDFEELVKSIREVELICGSTEKQFSEDELNVASVARKSIVSTKDLTPGYLITRNDICYKRPGLGINPFDSDSVIGKTVKTFIPADTIIKKDFLII